MRKVLLLNLFIAIFALLVGFGIGRKIYAPEKTDRVNDSTAKSIGKSNNDDKIDYFPPLPGSRANVQGSAEGAYAIEVYDQRPDTTVHIAKLQAASNVWVAVHEIRDGAPGNILGAARFRAGGTESGNIELLRPTVGEEQYVAMFHADDGDDLFDFAKDVPLRGADGEVIMAAFRAVGSPAQR